jgi:uncharacterized protein
MKISMYDACLTPALRALTSLAAILEKADAHAQARKIDPAVLVNSRLFPDMFPLLRQVQIAADIAKGGASRLAQVEPPVYEDKEATLADLVARLRKTIAYLETLQPAQFEGAEERIVTWQPQGITKSMPGMPYLLTHVLPNVYFHVTTTYNILRHNGVEIGKKDFLGTL